MSLIKLIDTTSTTRLMYLLPSLPSVFMPSAPAGSQLRQRRTFLSNEVSVLPSSDSEASDTKRLLEIPHAPILLASWLFPQSSQPLNTFVSEEIHSEIASTRTTAHTKRLRSLCTCVAARCSHAENHPRCCHRRRCFRCWN